MLKISGLLLYLIDFVFEKQKSNRFYSTPFECFPVSYEPIFVYLRNIEIESERSDLFIFLIHSG